MTAIVEAKAQARRLRQALAARAIALPHAAVLELVAAQLGFRDWNTAVAALQPAPAHTASAPAVRFTETIPILRIFDEAKAREFYCAFLGFAVQFEHRFAPDLPLYMGIARDSLHLHLSEHHGDASPGSTVFVRMRGVRVLHAELLQKQYRYGRPGISREEWGEVLEVHDPFGNRIRFCDQPD